MKFEVPLSIVINDKINDINDEANDISDKIVKTMA